MQMRSMWKMICIVKDEYKFLEKYWNFQKSIKFVFEIPKIRKISIWNYQSNPPRNSHNLEYFSNCQSS